MSSKIEEYKILIDIYYKEVNLLYSKLTIFTTIQLGVLTGILLKIDEFSNNTMIFVISIFLMIIFSFSQILISRRGFLVNEAVINTISEFEKKNNFSLLNDFNIQVKKLKGIKQMNFPSLLFTYISVIFLILWILLSIILIMSKITISFFYISFCFKYKNLIIIVLSILFAVSMKISDLLNEHGLKWFKGDSILFGIICGIIGSLLIMCNIVIANIVLAMVISFVIRRRIDYINHAIAFFMITSAFILFSKIYSIIYFSFLASTLILGVIKDLKYVKNKSKILKTISKIFLVIPIIYTIPSLAYSILSQDWMIFIAFFLFDLSYNITRIIGEKQEIKKYYQ